MTLWPNRFSGEEYLNENPDVGDANFNPEMHALIMGMKEGRLTSLKPIDRTPGGQVANPKLESIIVVSHEASRTGAPIVALEILKRLGSRYNVVSLILGDGELERDFVENSETLYRDYVVRRSRIGFEGKLGKIIKNHNPKFAIVNSLESRGVLESFKKLGIPTILLIHEFVSYTKPLNSVSAAIKHSTRVVFSTDLTRDDAFAELGSLPQEKISIFPQGKSEIPNAQGEASDYDTIAKTSKSAKFRILGAGYVQYRKGVDLFIEVAKEFNLRNPDANVDFVWLGDGYRPEHDLTYSVYLKDQINRSNVTTKVSIAPAVSNFESELNESNVFLLTSRLDPLPNVAIDALCAGLPLVCFEKASGFPRLAKDFEMDQILSTPFASTHDMVVELENLYKNRNELMNKRENWAKSAAKVFDFEAYVQKLVGLLPHHEFN